ncbi:MAG: hypothetical protein D6753_13900, partial [Planctomycetota bacterium]
MTRIRQWPYKGSPVFSTPKLVVPVAVFGWRSIEPGCVGLHGLILMRSRRSAARHGAKEIAGIQAVLCRATQIRRGRLPNMPSGLNTVLPTDRTIGRNGH